MNIGFWLDYDYTYLFTKVFSAIKDKHPSSRVSGFIVNDRYYSHAQGGLPQGSTLLSLYDIVAHGRKYRYTEEEYAAFRNFDETHRLSRVAYSDRIIHKFHYNELISLYIYLIKEFREYARKEKPDVFLFNCVASQFAHLCYLVLREERVRVIIPFHFGVEDLFYLGDNPYFQCPDIVSTFDKLKTSQTSLSTDEDAWARGFLRRVRAMEPAYSNAAIPLEQGRFALPSPMAIARYLYNYLIFYRNDPNQPALWDKILGPVQFRIRQKRASRLFVSLEEACRAEFVYFPLHFEPEIVTLIFAQYDQTSVIDMVARQLPLSCRLVVKEHPAMVGQRPYDFYERIVTRYPNVVFIEPSVNSLTLVQRARAVLTLSGTVILEALILEKPVIFTSTARFGGFGLGTFTQDFLNFNEVLRRATEQAVGDGELIAMLASIRRHSYRLQFAEPLGAPQVLHENNVAALADAVMEQVYAPGHGVQPHAISSS